MLCQNYFQATTKNSYRKYINRRENWINLFAKIGKICFRIMVLLYVNELYLNGNVRSNSGTNYRIDISGFNPKTKRFIIFELKKSYDKNITDQAAGCKDYTHLEKF
jgi:hypothetical protein